VKHLKAEGPNAVTANIGLQVDHQSEQIDPSPIHQDLEPQRSGPATLKPALDNLRFEAICEAAELAEHFAALVADAAERGERLRVRAYAGLLSRAARNALLAVAELGDPGITT
jgi:hypothetical protein